MLVSDTVYRMGGLGRRRILVRLLGRRRVDRAIARGEIVRVARGRYALPSTPGALVLAGELSGILGLESAALHHGWEVAVEPPRPVVVVPKDRRVSPANRRRASLTWVDLGPDEHDGLATSPEVTLAMCARRLPFPRALAVADSALRAGFSQERLRALAIGPPAPGSRQLRRVVVAARAEAANPFESVLRAIALDVPGLAVKPQLVIGGPGWTIRPDLIDKDLRVVLEADSFQWHGGRQALDADATRYNRLVVAGWAVLRFSWEAVMLRPEEVRDTLVALVGQRTNLGLSAASPRLDRPAA
ncbi:MAG: DUF559 domain-containing protein [Nostocoides sp.]